MEVTRASLQKDEEMVVEGKIYVSRSAPRWRTERSPVLSAGNTFRPPNWVTQTVAFVKTELFGVDMDEKDLQEEGLLAHSEDGVHFDISSKRTEDKKRRAWWIGVPIVLLSIFALVGVILSVKSESTFGFRVLFRQAEARQVGPQEFLLGVGKADITGPVVELNFMGYADGNQIGTGLRQRLYSRTFIIGNPDKPADRFVYLVLDTAMGDTAVRNGILEGVKALGPGYEMYGQSNVAVTGTHSHSGPAAWLNYLLPQITSKGFDKQSYQAIVDGGVLSVKRAHESLAPGYLSQGSKKVFGANINRSLYAYLNNPEEERARYNVSSTDDGQVEKDLTMLKFSDLNGNGRGVLTWFPVHGTSMLGNNTLVTGDNKGVAAYLFEKAQPAGFVAGFSQANVGDTTPNVEGAWCEDGTGVQCDFQKSVCSDGTSKYCHGRGPFFRETPTDNGAASCFEIGRLQVEAALELYSELDASASVQGGTVKSFHLFHDMSTFQFALPNGTNVRTCPAALGYSFAAGTTDGPGLFDFTQNDPGKPDANPIWAVVSGILKAPSKAQKACHWPKPILLDVGEIKIPYQWTPNIVDVQVLRVGNFFIIVSPGEATTMAGRRWKAAIGEKAKSLGLLASGQEPVVVIGGPANTYTHYISTPEEYAIQRYEGASTLYGPWTLPAYIKVSTENLEHLAEASTEGPPPGPTPPDHRGKSLSFITGVVYDNPPLGKKFGQVRTQVQASYRPGQSVEVSFVGANPRNNLKLEGTYVAVEKQSPDGGFVQVLDDEDWEVVMHWRRLDGLLGSSEVRVVWEVPEGVERGKYRIRYFGDAKQPVTKRIVGFEGASGLFDIV